MFESIRARGPCESYVGFTTVERARVATSETVSGCTVAPGIVDTPLHANNPKDFLKTLSPTGQIAAGRDIAEAVFYLTQASQVTGETLHVDGGAHLGLW